MQWLNRVVEEVVARTPKGEILIESGSSPSGQYHLGSLRELAICDAILIELRKRGRRAKHIAYVDDLDALRKIPGNIPSEYEKYLGMSLCDIPAPDGSEKSYAEYFIQDLKDAAKTLAMEIEFIDSHKKYRGGFFGPAIEKALGESDKIREILEKVSGHKLGEEWSPIQVNEGGYLKKRPFSAIDTSAKTISYQDAKGKEQTTSYDSGQVKLDWRIDWPARWWLLKVDVEPAGRDHSTKGGSFDTGLAISKEVFSIPGPLPIKYDFVNLAGDPKKMSASRGTGVGAAEAVEILPPQVVRFFMLRYPPSKRIYLDPQNVYRLIDEFEEFMAKPSKTAEEESLAEICVSNLQKTTSSIPFSHLVATYQASLKNPYKTLDLLRRNTKVSIDEEQSQIITRQLEFVDNWLDKWASDEVKFDLLDKIDESEFPQEEHSLLNDLAAKIDKAPEEADGEWFHKAIYDLKEERGLRPEQVFKPLYRVLIGKESGPRAGWFLSILPRNWLVKRLKMKE